MPQPARILPALIATAAFALALASGASAKPLGGVQIDGISAGETSASIATQLSTVSAAHGNIVRVEVDWSRLQPKAAGVNDPRALANLDTLIAGAATRRIKVLLFVDRTPCWASSAPRKSCNGSDPNSQQTTSYGPSNNADFVNVSTFLASRYGAKLAAYEVWNEPDQANEKYWAGPDKVARYVALVKAVYQPLKAANPQLQVLAGGFVGTNGKWLQAMYDAGVKGSYDGLAVHFYDLPLAGLKTTRQVEQKNGDTAPLWLTEYGWTSCRTKGARLSGVDHPCVTAGGQAQAVTDLLHAVARTSWLKATIMYRWRDENTSYRFGLLDSKGKRKPVFAAIKRAFGARSLTALRKPTIKLRKRGNHLIASGTGSITDTFAMTLRNHGVLRFRAFFRTSASGTWTISIPAVVGSSGVTVRVASQWSGRSASASR